MCATTAVAPVRAIIDARPILDRNTSTVWGRAEKHRDELYNAFAEAVTQEGFEALLLKSDPFVYPPWVRVTCWVPQGSRGYTERVGSIITIETKPYYRSEFEYTVMYTEKDHDKTISRVLPFAPATAREIVRFLLHRGSKPKFTRFRTAGWQLWRPKNKVDTLSKDWLVVMASVLTLVGVLGMSAVSSLGWLVLLAGLATLVTGIFLVWRAGKRGVLVRTEGKPQAEPRRLSRVDSWQTVLFGAGEQVSRCREEFFAQLKSRPTEGFRYAVEKVWYWGLDGKEEREQIVLCTGRAIVFCQIYQYGSDLYVGWDGHVNYGQWVEQTIARGYDPQMSKPVTISTVVPGSQSISEYDLIDLSCLMEWTHAQLVKLCKQLIRELKIDQEIDFKVLRGGRQGLTNAPQEEPAGTGFRSRLAGAFKRTG
jgi:hypothetical protein